MEEPESLDIRIGTWTPAAINTLHRSLAQAIAELAEHNELLRQSFQSKRYALELTSISNAHKLALQAESRPANGKEPDEPEWTRRRTSSERLRLQRTYSSKRRTSRRMGCQTSASSEAPVVISRTPLKGPRPPPRSFRLRDSICAASAASGSPVSSPVSIQHHKRPSDFAANTEADSPAAVGIVRKAGRYHRRQQSSKHLPAKGPQNELVLAFQFILNQTNLHRDTNQRSQARIGAPSLTATCFRTMPIAIEHEQQLRFEEGPDDKCDVASEVFDILLERPWLDYASSRQMAEVVRARAVHQLRDAIAAGVIDVLTYRAIWESCVKAKCMTELDILETAWHSIPRLQRCEELGQRPVARCNIVLENSFRMRGGFQSVTRYKQLRWAFKAGALDASFWTAANTNSVLRDATTHSHAAGEPSLLLAELLQTGLRGGAKTAMESKVSDNMVEAAAHTEARLCPLVAQLTATAIQNPSLRLVWPIRCAIDGIAAGTTKLGVVTRMLVLAANTVLDVQDTYPVHTRHSHFAWLCETARKATNEHLEIVAEYLVEVAHGLAYVSANYAFTDSQATNANRDIAFDFLQPTLEAFLAYQPIITEDASADRAILRRIVLSAALAFAHNSFSPQRIAYARSIEESITRLKRDAAGTATMFISPEKPVTRRWEEGLCEWVALTPAPTKPVIEATANEIRGLHVSSPIVIPDDLPTPPPSTQDLPMAIKDEEPGTPVPRKRSWQIDGSSDDFDALPSSEAIGAVEAAADREIKRPRFLRAGSSALNIMPLRKALRKAKSFVLDQKEDVGGDELA